MSFPHTFSGNPQATDVDSRYACPRAGGEPCGNDILGPTATPGIFTNLICAQYIQAVVVMPVVGVKSSPAGSGPEHSW